MDIYLKILNIYANYVNSPIYIDIDININYIIFYLVMHVISFLFKIFDLFVIVINDINQF